MNLGSFFKRKNKEICSTLNKKDLNFFVTLWPSFTHFKNFAYDDRLKGIRLNSAMTSSSELDSELKIIKNLVKNPIDLYFDVKGRQLRVVKSEIYKTHLELVINHPIEVNTPVPVLFKAGNDSALLLKIVDGTRLVFDGGPHFLVKEGESIHIRDENLKVGGNLFSDFELEKIQKVKNAGFNKYFLSYAESQKDLDEFRSYINKDDLVILKIESKKGLDFVANKYVKKENTNIMAARGDLYVELDKPHEILKAMKTIISKEPEAFVGSRILLSVVNPVPECDDFSDLAWLYDIGYRNMMLCDEICLKQELLSRAVNILDSFRRSYHE